MYIFAKNLNTMKKGNKKEKPKHYGKLLSKAIEEKGIKKKHVYEKLCMSKPTLNTRLIDGHFTQAEIEIIEAEWLN